jgi:hypothetical protein
MLLAQLPAWRMSIASMAEVGDEDPRGPSRALFNKFEAGFEGEEKKTHCPPGTHVAS